MTYSLLKNQIFSLPQSLPARWRAPDGYTVTNLAERSAEQLQAWGWYPVIEVKPELPAYASYGTPEMALDGDTVTATYPVILPAAPIPPKLTPVEFKMCFTPQERIGIKAVRETDLVLQDAYEILDDPRLTEVDLTLASVQGLIDYLGTLNLLTSERIEQVKMGVVL